MEWAIDNLIIAIELQPSNPEIHKELREATLKYELMRNSAEIIQNQAINIE